MRRIRSKDTTPEMAARSLVHCLGFRFRLHRKDLPGKPDLVFPGRRKVIFVHGCFWHQHSGCLETHVPKTNAGYWAPKLAKNVLRDRRNKAALRRLGWRYLVIWECHIKSPEAVAKRVVKFLEENTVD